MKSFIGIKNNTKDKLPYEGKTITKDKICSEGK